MRDDPGGLCTGPRDMKIIIAEKGKLNILYNSLVAVEAIATDVKLGELEGIIFLWLVACWFVSVRVV